MTSFHFINGKSLNDQHHTEEDTRDCAEAQAICYWDTREAMEAKYGEVWDTRELQKAFRVKAFQAPFCAVVRKADGHTGSLQFNHDPRFYFSFADDHDLPSCLR